MSRARRLLAATLLAGLVLPAHADMGRPILRLDVTVAGDVVRLGDLFDNAGRHADVAVFRSPDPGHTGQVAAWRIVEAARRAGLEPESSDRNRDVNVTRDARIVPLAEMEEKIAASLAGTLGLGDSSRVQVVFDRGTRPLTVERQAAGQVDILRLEHDPRSGRFDAVLGIRGSGRSERTGGFRVYGTANELVEFAAPARTIGRGEIVRASDLVIDRKPRSALPMMTADTVVSLAQAVGLAARRPLSPERPFRTSDLMKPELVERNASIIIIVELPGLSLTMRGKALEAGAEGDVIQVENIQSRKKMQAVVTGLNRVSLATRQTTVVAATRTP